MSSPRNRFSQTELENLRKEAYKWLDKCRIPHVHGCEEEAVRLARHWGGEEDSAAAAAILHDCTKNRTDSQHLDLICRYGLECDEALLAAPKLYHAVTGAAIAKDVFRMPEDICSAIRWHTTGRPGMSLLEKIIYLADYIEPTRSFPGVEPLRSLAYEDLDSALALGLSMSMEEVRSKGRDPYYMTREAYEYYKERKSTHAIS